MQAGWRIGSLFGIPLYIDLSWLYVLAIFTYINGSRLQERYSEWGNGLVWGTGFLMTLLLFGSVLLHELGHSLVARSQGIAVNAITLFLFGGVASIDRESKTPGQAFQVAIAGPAVSIALFLLLTLLGRIPPLDGPVKVLAENVASVNLILALFNLIPGLPLDGGQVLKAAVWKLTGNRYSGVRWAAKSGLILGWGAILLGLFTILQEGSTAFGGAFWLALIGWFILSNASKYDQLTSVQEALLQILAQEAMTRDFRVVNADMTLRQFADEYILRNVQTGEVIYQPYYAASDGRYRGLVSVEDFNFVERSLWETQTLQSIVRPLTQIVTVEEKTPLVEAINCMEANQLRRITVLSPAGAIAGVIDRSDIVRAVAAKLKIAISEVEIKRIKAEGTYPPALQLQSIAKSTIP
jgi:Zn-dependent protease/CBS domain-containing protein